MGARGKQSSAALVVPDVARDQRLAAPVHLSDAEREVWIELVNDQPADAFTVAHIPLIEQYCRHVIQSRLLSDEMLNFDRAWLSDDDGLKRYDRLLAMHEREGRAASSLATRLRITRQATVHPVTAGRAESKVARKPKPWELARS